MDMDLVTALIPPLIGSEGAGDPNQGSIPRGSFHWGNPRFIFGYFSAELIHPKVPFRFPGRGGGEPPIDAGPPPDLRTGERFILFA